MSQHGTTHDVADSEDLLVPRPLLLVYGRDGSVVLNASDYTPGQVIEAINAARAKEATRGE